MPQEIDAAVSFWSAAAIPIYRETPLSIPNKDVLLIQSAVAASLCRRTPNSLHRIVTAGTKRLATEQPPDSHASSS